ncbi:hypothetical protein ACFW1A_33045 [Kitasatospora sp. NPDC058965]|uniref:hypothetical protein n=1 Tax=Kitasatospora sp. NPDC058965 TaxID=3346682 RepID=UPI0036860596
MSKREPFRPGWSTPPSTPPPRPGGKPGLAKTVGIGCLGLVGLLVLAAAIGATADGKQSDTVTSAPLPTAGWHSTAPAAPAPTTAPASSSPPAPTDDPGSAPAPSASAPVVPSAGPARPTAPAKPVTPTTPAAQTGGSGSGGSGSGGSGAAACHPLTNAGRCYLPGEFCRATDRGVTGVDGRGDPIVCRDNNGLRWEPA